MVFLRLLLVALVALVIFDPQVALARDDGEAADGDRPRWGRRNGRPARHARG